MESSTVSRNIEPLGTVRLSFALWVYRMLYGVSHFTLHTDISIPTDSMHQLF
jgi:hypothetical protein